MKRKVPPQEAPSRNVVNGKITPRATVMIGLALFAATLTAHPGAGAAIALRAATPDQPSVTRYGKLELTLDLEASYTNPFDPAQIDVYAVFTSPAQQLVRVHGFLFQPFRRRMEGGAEQFDPAGPPVWKVRFTPDTVGTWHYQVFAQDRTGYATLPAVAIDVTPSASAGFIRRSDRNPRVFAYEDGRPFFPVGENMAWAGKRGTLEYEEWIAALRAAGGNWIRIWMASWNCALEWSRQGEKNWRTGDYSGVGFYSLRNAWKLDTILDLAERYDMKVMVTFGTFGEFTERGYFNEGQWSANPYRAANGGPCAQPEDFWTDPQARSLYRQRLRYLMARYAYRTSIHAWEFWNEAKAPASWVGEMASYLKGTGAFAGQPADPYGHLLTTTYGTPDIWKIAEIDFTQTHRYGQGDIPDHAPLVYDDAQLHRVYGKPHLMSEFGIDFRAPDTRYDPDRKGVNLHNALWASALSGNAGSAMIWWWDNYVHPGRVYAHFAPLRQFVDSIPWTTGAWASLDVKAPSAVVYGLVFDRSAILWAHNPQNHWSNVLAKKPVAALPSQEAIVRGLPSGRYTIEWWDTWKGGVTKRETVTCGEKRLTLRLPELETDVAARIVPADSEAGSAASLPQHAREFRAQLSEKVLPYWYDTAQDTEHGGYLLADDGKRRGQASDKLLVTQSRMLWGFSHAHVRGFSTPRRSYLDAARQGYRFLLAHFRDPDQGGYFWKTDLAGAPIADGKFLYGQCFVVYAFVEYFRASGDREALRHALDLYRVVQQNLHDRQHGGWIEHADRYWHPLPPGDRRNEIEVVGLKSASTHLHWMEALTELYVATHDADVKQSLEEVLRINQQYFFPPDPGRSSALRQPDWQPAGNPASAWISYGHNVEFAWLMVRAAQVLGRIPSWHHIYALLDHALLYGYDEQRGGLYYRGLDNRPATDTDKVWWVQAELLAALSTAVKHRANADYERALDRLLHFLVTYQINPADGIWLDTVTADGRPKNPARAHNWKANYHDLRAVLQFIDTFAPR